MPSVRKAIAPVVERLEQRALMSGVPLAVSSVDVFGQSQLRINSIWGNDHLTVTTTAGGLVIGNSGRWAETVAGTFSQIIIHAGRGNDFVVVDPSVHTDCTIYGGSGKNVLVAGSGNDTLVTIGSKADTLIGGAGRDAFWTDASPKERIVNLRGDEIAAGAVHRVSAFYNGAGAASATPTQTSRAMLVRRLPEPSAGPGASYQDFSGHPLFAAGGPSPDDTFQGQVGDCYLLASLSAIAKADPVRIRQSILDMGDGTYLVQFSRGGSKVYVRVDGQLPVNSAGSLDYADFGGAGSMWVAIMEKAYAIFHGPSPAYASIDGGWMTDAFSALGANGDSLYSADGPTALLWQINQELAGGRAVTYATATAADGAPLLDQHAYSVDAVTLDAEGNLVGLRLRNPWGVSGAGTSVNDHGYVTITAQQAYDSMLGVVSAVV